jgi:flagellar M-ring protein FliF
LPGEIESIPQLYIYIGAGALALLIAIVTLVIILMSKKKKKKRKAATNELESMLSRNGAVDQIFGNEPLPQITPVKDARREQIREFAETNPEIAAQMIRSWLKSEGD